MTAPDDRKWVDLEALFPDFRARFAGHEPLPSFLHHHPDATAADLGPPYGWVYASCYPGCEPCAALTVAMELLGIDRDATP
jgi:hypothetical protein